MALKTAGERTTFPALRCVMGDWIYYVTYMRFSDVAFWIKPPKDIYTNKGLWDMIQRELRIKTRVPEIASYLVEQEARFFSSIVVGVYGGAPVWRPIEVRDSPVVGSPGLDEDAQGSIGLLMFNGDEHLYAIDGQHRVEGIKQALRTQPELADEDLSVIFVAYKNKTQIDRMRVRQLFSTLNRYAKPVSKGEIVALNEDDAFAIVTRRLVEDHPLLRSSIDNKSGFISFGTTTPVRATDRKHLTTVLALYDLALTIHMPILDPAQRRSMQSLLHRRPSEAILDSILKEQKHYWNLLVKHLPEYDELFKSNPEEEVAGKYRQSGGHLMFRPVGQLSFGRAVRIMMDRGKTMQQAVRTLSAVPMDLNAPPWRHVLWNPTSMKVNTKVSPLLTESLLLYYVREAPRKANYPLLNEYRKEVDDENAELPPHL